MEDFLTGKKHVHFIGIGGSGMYPLAQILHSKGFYLTGSDNNEQKRSKRYVIWEYPYIWDREPKI